jgi:acetate kinase
VEQLEPAVPQRMVVAHLGNGASITAIRNRQSIDTSMGLTPMGGIMMGTRCGDVDPGAMIFAVRNGAKTPDELEHIFEKESGLAGVSGLSNDVRELMRARAETPAADLALRMFSYQTKKEVAAMAAVLGGLDTLVFTGGIGEHATELREGIINGVRFLGEFATLTLPSQEDLQIARVSARLVN